ncbi:hypothetical protein ASG36_19655 [Geodermatophilus sp. Leaf369]|jgi:glycine cleavage system H protein|uniref:glycine cleavage system protein GcvH n=1 Tax=Geodermatophilus sp. Leaf369 TaxID=1736354 RepID=UPI0006FD16BA|nr:glycine cleavage system protein GcvH [Geodermatophilus sp. Leaf369]KQS54683.1 hypothetical protein ASG36_19655 [Geodermatophilus sp. Leaf369]
MATPDDRRYTDQHEWAQVQGTAGAATVVRIGITDHAQDALGDIVFVQLPDVGEAVTVGNPIGEVESTKSVSDVYAPLAGTVSARNDALADTPETVNSDPYGEGWLIEIEVTGDDGDPTEALLDAAAYQALVEQG